MKRICFTGLILIILFNVFTFTAAAGGVAGLGHYFSVREGLEAVMGNPAFVNPEDDFFVLEIGAGAGVWNNALKSENLQEFLDEDKKSEILRQVEDKGMMVAGDGAQNLSLLLGNAGLYTGAREHVSGTISSDVVELLLEGNELDRVYSLEGTGGDVALYTDTGINVSLALESMARALELEQFKLGVTGRFLYGGFGYVDGIGEFEITSDGKIRGYEDGHLELEYAERARGNAFDVGIQARKSERFVLGAAVMNIGSLEAEEAYRRRYEYNEAEEEFQDSGEESLSELSYTLPRKYKLGLKYSPFRKLDIYGDYTRRAFDNCSDESIFAAGMELRPAGVLPLRMGANYSTFRGDIAFSTGLGLHLGPLQVDAGVSDLKFFTGSAKSARVSIGTRLAF
ncbi:MAG: hypothetical protein ACOCZM_00885 [Bacillota bacterium]